MFQECKFIVDGNELKESLRHSIQDENDAVAIINAALWRTCTGNVIDPIAMGCSTVLASIKARSVYETIKERLSPTLCKLSSALSDDHIFDLDFEWSGDVVIISVGEKEDDLSGIP